MSAPAAASFSSFSFAARPRFFFSFPPPFPRTPPFFLLALHAASHLGRYLASLYTASFFSPHLNAPYRRHPFFPLSSIACCPFFFPSTPSLLPPATALFSPLPFPCAPLLECHPELVSGSHYSIYPLVIVREMYEMPKRVRHDNLVWGGDQNLLPLSLEGRGGRVSVG